MRDVHMDRKTLKQLRAGSLGGVTWRVSIIGHLIDLLALVPLIRGLVLGSGLSGFRAASAPRRLCRSLLTMGCIDLTTERVASSLIYIQKRYSTRTEFWGWLKDLVSARASFGLSRAGEEVLRRYGL